MLALNFWTTSSGLPLPQLTARTLRADSHWVLSAHWVLCCTVCTKNSQLIIPTSPLRKLSHLKVTPLESCRDGFPPIQGWFCSFPAMVAKGNSTLRISRGTLWQRLFTQWLQGKRDHFHLPMQKSQNILAKVGFLFKNDSKVHDIIHKQTLISEGSLMPARPAPFQGGVGAGRCVWTSHSAPWTLHSSPDFSLEKWNPTITSRTIKVSSQSCSEERERR